MKKAVFTVVDPDSIEMELSCRASVRTWRNVEKALKAALNDGYDHHTNQLLSAIRDAIHGVDSSFVGFSESEDT